MTIATLTEVWNPLSVGIAVVSGAIVGYLVVGWFAVNPLYSSGEASPSRVGFLTFTTTTFVALVFYAGQTAATYLVGDPAWPRVASRYGIWVAFAAAIGLGTWVRIRRDRARRRARALDRALAGDA